MREIVRSVVICAPREAVYRFFTDSERFARWWGAGSRIDPRAGGELVIRYPDGVIAGGQVVEMDEGKRIVFTYGYADPKKPIPLGGSRVEVVLDEIAEGTRVTLRHSNVPPETVAEHAPGWRFQLSLFAKVVAADVHAAAEERVDAWFAAWNEPDPGARRAALACAADDVTFLDDYACIAGLDDLVDHIRAVRERVFAHVERDGSVAFCQGTALVRWRVEGVGAGTNVFDFGPDGRIERMVGFWGK
jgi:uncharacterized protein YndB with AHSA1/START domain